MEGVRVEQEEVPVSIERAQSVLYGSFELSQGSPSLQGAILKWIFVHHPEVRSAFAEHRLFDDEQTQKMIGIKVNGEDHVSNAGSVPRQFIDLKSLLMDYPPREPKLSSIISVFIERDYRYRAGRERTGGTVYKSFFVDYILLGIRYRGDVFLQELLDACREYFSEHAEVPLRASAYPDRTVRDLLNETLEAVKKQIVQGMYTKGVTLEMIPEDFSSASSKG